MTNEPSKPQETERPLPPGEYLLSAPLVIRADEPIAESVKRAISEGTCKVIAPPTQADEDADWIRAW